MDPLGHDKKENSNCCKKELIWTIGNIAQWEGRRLQVGEEESLLTLAALNAAFRILLYQINVLCM